MSARPWRLWWEDGEHVRRAAYKDHDAAVRDAERMHNVHLNNADTGEYAEYVDGERVCWWGMVDGKLTRVPSDVPD